MYQDKSRGPTAPGAKVPGGVYPKLSPVTYFQDLDERNELFGAGPSGTTGTLLAAAMTFGNLQDEMLKQYMFAIIGYLIGGGVISMSRRRSCSGCPSNIAWNTIRDRSCVMRRGTGGVTLAR